MILTTEIGVRFLLGLQILALTNAAQECPNGSKPNIIFIMADDAGWNDFSFHGSPQIPTPNIDAMAFNGIVLNGYYGSPLCTPTRGAVMTGKHPIHIGLQHFVIQGQNPNGLPLSEKLLPEYLQELGYITRLVGKWHLGHSRKVYTPTYRGFDSHFGYWLGMIDYYDHYHLDGSGTGWGHNFRTNLTENYDVFGQYCTDLFTREAVKIIEEHPKETPLFLMINHLAPHSGNSYDPLQAPKEYVERFQDTIPQINRRVYAAMVAKLDESVGQTVSALAKAGMLENSIIVFVSDNGGAPEGLGANWGSNWPLRGAKNTLWEGGTRLAGWIWSPFTKNQAVSQDVFHAQDWLPTLFEAAGGNLGGLGKIDGKSLWKTFTTGESSPVRTVLYNIDDIYNNSAVQHDHWKLIQGNTSTKDLGGGIWDFWYGPTGRDCNSSVADLIPQILNSEAGQAMTKAGFQLQADTIKKLQQEAEVKCNDALSPVDCDPYTSPCLFDLSVDPCEQQNLADQNPEMLEQLLSLLRNINSTAIPPIPRYKDPEGLPSKWGYVWTTWKDYTDPILETNDQFYSESESTL